MLMHRATCLRAAPPPPNMRKYYPSEVKHLQLWSASFPASISPACLGLPLCPQPCLSISILASFLSFESTALPLSFLLYSQPSPYPSLFIHSPTSVSISLPLSQTQVPEVGSNGANHCITRAPRISQVSSIYSRSSLYVFTMPLLRTTCL